MDTATAAASKLCSQALLENADRERFASKDDMSDVNSDAVRPLMESLVGPLFASGASCSASAFTAGSNSAVPPVVLLPPAAEEEGSCAGMSVATEQAAAIQTVALAVADAATAATQNAGCYADSRAQTLEATTSVAADAEVGAQAAERTVAGAVHKAVEESYKCDPIEVSETYASSAKAAPLVTESRLQHGSKQSAAAEAAAEDAARLIMGRAAEELRMEANTEISMETGFTGAESAVAPLNVRALAEEAVAAGSRTGTMQSYVTTATEGPPPMPPRAEKEAAAVEEAAVVADAAMSKQVVHAAEAAVVEVSAPCKEVVHIAEVKREGASVLPVTKYASMNFKGLGQTELTSLYAQFPTALDELCESSPSLDSFVAECGQAFESNEKLRKENDSLRTELDKLLSLTTPEMTPPISPGRSDQA
jgi:hypothetical protein